MKMGFVLPRGDARQVMEFAVLAEEAGWDGIFVWEPVWGIDAWVCLTAAAVPTTRIQLGTMLSPISRMKPWQLAGQTATLANLSGGRVVLSVGLGAVDTGFREFGEATDIVERAELVDEGLEILRGLWAGQPFNHDGKHYQVRETSFVLPPSPPGGKVPVWMVGLLGSRKSMARALTCDGILPSVRADDGGWRPLVPDDVREIRRLADEAGRTDADIVVEGQLTGKSEADVAAELNGWQAAGATWFIDGMWEAQFEPDILDRIQRHLSAGPPRAGQ